MTVILRSLTRRSGCYPGTPRNRATYLIVSGSYDISADIIDLGFSGEMEAAEAIGNAKKELAYIRERSESMGLAWVIDRLSVVDECLTAPRERDGAEWLC